MSELILTDDEKAATWAEASDKTIADIVRHVMVTAKELHTSGGSTDPLFAAAGLMTLCDLAVKSNATTVTYELTEVTVKDNNLGDWKISIEKLPAAKPTTHKPDKE